MGYPCARGVRAPQAKFRAHPDIVAQLPELEREVSEGRLTAGQGADTLLAIMGLHDTDPILPLP